MVTGALKLAAANREDIVLSNVTFGVVIATPVHLLTLTLGSSFSSCSCSTISVLMEAVAEGAEPLLEG